MEMRTVHEPSMWKRWFIAFRVWSFTAAAIPITLGAVWAWSLGYFNKWLFILTLIGGIAIQAGTNLINTYYDFRNGVDTPESAKSCPVLVAQWLCPNHVKIVGLLSFLIAAVIGMYLVYLRGFFLLALGVLGIIGGYCYTGGIAYKYRGLGSTFVFFLMGPLMVWGAFFVQTGFHSLSVILVSLPISFLVSGILHANDLRDLEHDKSAGILTLAIITGWQKGLLVHFFLYGAAFLSVLGLVIYKIISPWVLVIVFIALPAGIRLMQHTLQAHKGNKEKLQMLELEAAQFHLKFGILYTFGIFVGVFI